MLNIHFLGSGGAFDIEQGNSAAWIVLDNKNILLDCGHSVYPTLRRLQRVEKIDYVLLTHLHDDHCGSLGSLVFHYNLLAPKKKLKILYPTEEFREQIHAFLRCVTQTPAQLVEFIPLSQFQTITAINTYGLHMPHFQTFAYYFETKEKSFLYSGDIGDPDFLFEWLKQHNKQPQIVFHDITFFKEAKPHAYYKAVAKHLKDFTIIGYHHNPADEPEDNPIPLVAHSEFSIK